MHNGTRCSGFSFLFRKRLVRPCTSSFCLRIRLVERFYLFCHAEFINNQQSTRTNYENIVGGIKDDGGRKNHSLTNSQSLSLCKRGVSDHLSISHDRIKKKEVEKCRGYKSSYSADLLSL